MILYTIFHNDNLNMYFQNINRYTLRIVFEGKKCSVMSTVINVVDFAEDN